MFIEEFRQRLDISAVAKPAPLNPRLGFMLNARKNKTVN
jgi:hypothetical protein